MAIDELKPLSVSLVEGNITVTEGHNISEEAKARLIQKGPNIIDVIVHLSLRNQHRVNPLSLIRLNNKFAAVESHKFQQPEAL
jgi:hypothetical protein